MRDSPCINDCVIQNGYCRGCMRTLDEISNWRKYDSRKREEICRIIKKRGVEEKGVDTGA